MKDLSIAICTLNAEATIEEVLKSCLQNCEKNNLFIVDGNSSDGTVAIAKKYTSRIYFDPGKGLAAARNVALDNCKTKYLLYVGPDNILFPKMTESVVNEMLAQKWVGISCTSLYANPTTYFEKCFNLYKKSKYYPGIKNLIGTPSLYCTEILKKYRWNEINGFSDDTELGMRLTRDKHLIGISKYHSLETGAINIKEIKDRWRMYGKSDFEFYMTDGKYYKSYLKKMRSFFNAYVVDFLKPLASVELKTKEKLELFPFLLIITFYRHMRFVKLIMTTPI